MSENEPASEPTEEGAVEVSRITIVRLLTVDDGLVDYVQAVDRQGDDIPLTEALGMLVLAQDSLIREAMGEARD